MFGLGESRNCIRGYFLLERQRPRSLIILLLIRDFGVCSFCTFFSLGLITSQKSWSDESCNLASPLRPVGALCGMKMFILSAVFWLVVLWGFFLHPLFTLSPYLSFLSSLSSLHLSLFSFSTQMFKVNLVYGLTISQILWLVSIGQ